MSHSAKVDVLRLQKCFQSFAAQLAALSALLHNAERGIPGGRRIVMDAQRLRCNALCQSEDARNAARAPAYVSLQDTPILFMMFIRVATL